MAHNLEPPPWHGVDPPRRVCGNTLPLALEHALLGTPEGDALRAARNKRERRRQVRLARRKNRRK